MLIELIQVAIGLKNELSHIPTVNEWDAIFNTAILQSVAGVCFPAIQRLPKIQRPPEQLYWEWLGLVSHIQQQNELMDMRTANVWRHLKDAGLDAVVLKGQGIALEYGELAVFRQSGDIDIWVKGGYKTVCNYVQKVAPSTDVVYHRFHFDVYKDTEVELHHRPTLMRNLFDNKKLAKWYDSFGEDTFTYLEDKGFAVPPREFNRIFILTHIYRHFLFEGVGLRQVMDCYYVLSNEKVLDESKKNKEEEILRSLNLTRFAEAMMWLLHTQFGLEEKLLICGMNDREGRFLLNEILIMGNFGRADKRYLHLGKIRHRLTHGKHLLLHYPSEVLWTPIWLMYHKVWKWNKQRQIRQLTEKNSAKIKSNDYV